MNKLDFSLVHSIRITIRTKTFFLCWLFRMHLHICIAGHCSLRTKSRAAAGYAASVARQVQLVVADSKSKIG